MVEDEIEETTDDGRPTTLHQPSSVVGRPSSPIRLRARKVGLVKFIIGALFFAVVLVNLRHPATIIVSVLDLALVPVFVWLAPRRPQLAAYGMVLSTALLLTPRQFVQGYVNGINWPIYIAVPLIGGYLLRTRRGLLISALLTGVVALPAMLVAALTLPPGMTRADMLTLLVFVAGLLIGCAIIIGDMLKDADHELETGPPGS